MEKKNYTMFQNIVFYIREVHKIEPRLILKSVFFAIVSVVTMVIPTLIASLIVSLVLANASISTTAVQIMVVSLLSGFFVYMNSRTLMTKNLNGIEYRINYFAYKLYKKFLRADFESLNRKEIFTIYNQAIENGVSGNSNGAEALYIESMNFLGNFLGILVFSWVMARHSMLIVILVLLSAIINYGALSFPRNFRKKNRDKWANLDSMIHIVKNDVIKTENGKDARVFNIAPIYMEKVDEAVNERIRWTKRDSSNTLYASLITLVTKVFRDGVTYLYLIQEVFRGMSIAEFTFLFNFMTTLDIWITETVNAAQKISLASQDITDYRHFLNLKIDVNSGTRSIEDKSIKVEFKNVYFKYDSSQNWVLEDVSFVIEPNQKMALVGINGAGKSTLVNIMMGLLTPQKGMVLINDIPIELLDEGERIGLFSPVFQENEIWALTVLQNITLSKEKSVDRERVYALLDSLGLKDKIMSLDHNLDTPLTRNIEPNGVELSGGESQKLMLARALYKDAPVLILDEPTAALDAIAEQALYEEYVRFAKDKTSLFISHRLSSTRFCDQIMLLDGGKIIENGTHSALIKQDGVYASMYAIQSQYYQKEENNYEEVLACI